jgi:membrane-bound lytic murein transglycosylase MltF
MIDSGKLAVSLCTIAMLIFCTGKASADDKSSTITIDPMGNEAVALIEKRTYDPIANNRRAIRVLVNYNMTNYFVVEGKQGGLEFELMHAFEKFLNKGLPAEKHYHLVFITAPFDRLISDLVNGEGDIVAAGLTVTESRQQKVTFTDPYLKDISEVVVRNKQAQKIPDADALSGKTVNVVKGSSYVTHLHQLNARLAKKKRKPVKIVEVDEYLASEDLLEMANAGIFDYVVVDSHIAQLWAKVLSSIIVEQDARISDGNEIAWAIRKNNTTLKQKLNSFVKEYKQGTLLGNVLFNRYYNNTKWVTNPVSDNTLKRLHEYEAAFKKYGKQYHIDWLMLVAQGYQESKLNQSVQSSHGAVGVMQIKPSTAADKNIGITGVKKSYDRNIHAGTKYLNFLRERYFSDPKIPPVEQLAFTLAAYNAGPARINQMRNKAKSLGKDPNKWFFNVENVTRQYASSEPVTYVANIMKYFVAFKSALAVGETRLEAAEKIMK